MTDITIGLWAIKCGIGRPAICLLVAYITLSMPHADEEPFEAPSRGFENVPGVEGIDEGFFAEATAKVWRGSDWVLLRSGTVWSAPREGKDVEDSEDGHLQANKHAVDTGLDVGVC